MNNIIGLRARTLGFVVVAALACAAPALAQDGDAARTTAAAARQWQAADQALLDKAWDDFGQRRFEGLASHIPALEAALARGPKGPITDYQNPYPIIALTLGLYFNEKGDPRKAVGFLDKGLALWPLHPALTSEKSAALVLLKDWAGSLAINEAALADATPKAPTDEARLLRGKGFALIELGRLDEAEAAYRRSLELQPGHGGALHELSYIEGQRGGAPKEEPGIFTGDEAVNLGKKPSEKP